MRSSLFLLGWASLALTSALADMKDSCLAPKQDVHSVLDACARFIDSNPPDLERAAAHFNRGVSHMALGLPYLAISDFNQSLASDPSHYAPWAGLAEANVRLRDLKTAQKNIQKALAIEPDRPDGQDMRAVINQELGNTDDLLSAGEAEIRLNPKGAFGYERRGEAYSRKGEIEKAAADFQRATLLNPGQASAWARLGTLKAIQGDKSGAFEAFDRALAIDPTWIEALVNRGKLYADEGRMDEAATDFRASLNRSSDSGRARQLQKEALTRWVVITKRIPPAEPRTSLDPR